MILKLSQDQKVSSSVKYLSATGASAGQVEAGVTVPCTVVQASS